MKKALSILILLTLCLAVVPIPSAAAQNMQQVWFKFNGGGSYCTGGVNGAQNGKYYTLNQGSVRLDLNMSCNYGEKQLYVTLYRERFGPDKSYGTKYLYTSLNGKDNTLRWNVDQNSGKYYLYITGGCQGATFEGKGYIYNE